KTFVNNPRTVPSPYGTTAPHSRGAGTTLFLGHDLQIDLDVELAVQVHPHREITRLVDRPFRHADLAARDLHPDLREGFGNVDRADRAIQLAFRANVRRDDELHATNQVRARLRRGELFGGRLFQLLPAGLEFLD